MSRYQRCRGRRSSRWLTIISDVFAFRVDIWDAIGNSIVEHVAGVNDFEVAEAAYRAAVARWPRARITLLQGARGSCMRPARGSTVPRPRSKPTDPNVKA